MTVGNVTCHAYGHCGRASAAQRSEHPQKRHQPRRQRRKYRGSEQRPVPRHPAVAQQRQQAQKAHAIHDGGQHIRLRRRHKHRRPAAPRRSLKPRMRHDQRAADQAEHDERGYEELDGGVRVEEGFIASTRERIHVICSSDAGAGSGSIEAVVSGVLAASCKTNAA